MKTAIAALCAVALLAGLTLPASAQEAQSATQRVVADPPKRLGGRWYTPDRMYSQRFSLDEISAVRKTALITYWSTRDGCSFEKLHGSLDGWDGKTLKVSLLGGQNLCHPTMLIELQPQGGRKWGGSIHLNMQVTGAPALVHPELEQE